jgi:BirA family biotin operon repressor/biotin-[acetyl-CoA-carboxylase] ligase
VNLSERVLSDLTTRTRFHDVRLLDETTSTNTVAAGASGDGVVVCADRQTAGRGRLDRTWESGPGDGLLVSVRIEPDLPPARLHLVTAAAALAARDAVAETSGVVADIKWPNDLLVEGAKLAGILAETSGAAVVVGMGLNVHGGPPGAAVLDQVAGRRTSRADLLVSWLTGLDRRSRDWDAVASEYRAACSTVGRRVSVEMTSGERVEGTASGVDDGGRLVVEREGAEPLVVSVGDVTHLR